jgi:lysophospholipid acyltransferase (LPLAT)-like uncharacterized protein
MAAWLCSGYIRSLRLDGPSPAHALPSPTLIAVWHRDMAAALRTFLGIPCLTLTSNSQDGEFAAQVCRHLGVKAVRGSSSRGGLLGLRSLEKSARSGEGVRHIAFTVDGPKGPAGIPKPGIFWLARHLGWPLVQLEVERSPGIRLSNWDQTVLPWPGSRLKIRFSEPLAIPASQSMNGA